jgi:superfamily II DNA or RNA helicase
MVNSNQASEFYREYDLVQARKRGVTKTPAPHQASALRELDQWYRSASATHRGGILVLPTGGGKTFTAWQFICRNPLSDGYKILWLAHTHHLLEQAYFGLSDLVGIISEPKPLLSSRVVSGTIGHFPIHSIRPSDDVVVSSLQAASNAMGRQHQHFVIMFQVRLDRN